MNRAVPILLPLVVGCVGQRSAQRTNDVTAQFNLKHDPRYVPAEGLTFCNIWAWDFSRAMGAEVPHWVDGREMTANEYGRPGGWFETEGQRLGWREVRSTGSVLAEVNAGNVVIAVLHNPGGHGHITPVVPDLHRVTVANVGVQNFQRVPIEQAYGHFLPQVRYWVHA